MSRAASPPPARDWLPRAIAIAARVVLVLALVALVLGLLPGVEIYEDRNDCLGEALSRVFAWHEGGPHAACQPAYVRVRTEPAGGVHAVCVLAPVILGALWLARRPSALGAVVWSVASHAAALVTLVATFDLDLFSATREVALWPATAMAAALIGVFAILAVVLLGVPVVVLVRAVRRRRAARAAAPVFPTAVARDRPDRSA